MILVNPSRLDLVKMDREQGGYQEARAFLDKDNLYAWPVFDDLHANMAPRIGVNKEAIPLVIGFDGRGTVKFAMVTDYSRNTIWHHNPDITLEILHHPRLSRISSDLDIGYYDYAIVGDWSEIKEEDDELEEVNKSGSNNWYNKYIISCRNKENRPFLEKI